MVISISFKIKCTAFFQNSKSVRPPAELVRLLTELARLPADFRFKIQELVRLLADSRFQISDFRFQIPELVRLLVDSPFDRCYSE